MHNRKYIPWLRSLAKKGGKGGVDNVDARSLGRVADDLEAAQESNCMLIDQIAQFQKRIQEKSAQVRAETALRVEAEKRLADIIEILEPLDPPESYAAVVHKIAILANPERYACDPICEPAPTCCQYHRDGGDTYAACWNYGN